MPLDTEAMYKRVGSSHCWLAMPSYKLPHPLRSDVITTSSSLLRDDPSPSCASILSPFVVSTYKVFSWHHMKSSHVPQKSPDQARANCTPDANKQAPAELILEQNLDPSFDILCRTFSTPPLVHLSLTFLVHT